MFNYFLDLNYDFKSRLGIDLQCGVPCLVRLLLFFSMAASSPRGTLQRTANTTVFRRPTACLGLISCGAYSDFNVKHLPWHWRRRMQERPRNAKRSQLLIRRHHESKLTIIKSSDCFSFVAHYSSLEQQQQPLGEVYTQSFKP